MLEHHCNYRRNLHTELLERPADAGMTCKVVVVYSCQYEIHRTDQIFLHSVKTGS